MLKRITICLLVLGFISCGPKPQWKTREGKKKQKFYNTQQYDHKDRDKVLIKNMKKEKVKNKKH